MFRQFGRRCHPHGAGRRHVAWRVSRPRRIRPPCPGPAATPPRHMPALSLRWTIWSPPWRSSRWLAR